MVLTHIENTSNLPLSDAVISAGLVFVSGQVGVLVKGEITEDDVRRQTRQALENIRDILLSLLIETKHIVKVTVFPTEPAHIPEMNEAYRQFFGGNSWPARSTVCGVELVRPEFLVEIEAVASVAN
ncbi:RidA family protein [Paenarthrobacter sp. NPDC058040]|uniref:RidA family protein n=1 Tax=unclassified Paenarthrobacter TaxID=2634190 RepID=UPI0036DD1B98